MSYKSLLVHLDTSEAAQPRLELALRLAKQFDAHLTGLFTIFRPEPGSFNVMAGTAEYYVEQQRARAEREGALARLFNAELMRAQVEGEWKTSNEDANIGVPNAARLVDLAIIGQDNPDDPESFVAEQFVENLVLCAGRPVLVVPYAGQFAHVGTHVLVAWDGSREAARALYDALPFIARAEKTTLVTVNAPADEPPENPLSGTDVAAFVARHGANVVFETIAGEEDVPIGERLLSRASDLSADLIVMGAYGHSRWRELVLGGATRSMLDSMTVPVLMSH
jgi:nucleotide-binding universal stress UspA family protein